MKPRMKPCPFCGKRSKGKYITGRMRAGFYQCPFCDVCGPSPNIPDGLRSGKRPENQEIYDNLTADAWNTRNGIPDPDYKFARSKKDAP